MKTRFLKSRCRLLLTLASLLGITIGCEQPDMYGTPERPYNDTIAAKNAPQAQYFADNDVTLDN